MTAQPKREDFANDKEFNKAMDAWTLEQTKTKDQDQVKPSQRDIEGVITNVSREITKDNGTGAKTFRFITVGKEQLLLPKVMFDNNRDLLQVGNSVVVKAEERIANKTGYMDGTNWKQHTSSGLSFMSAVYSEQSAEAQGKELAKANGRVDLYTKAISQMATSLGNVDIKDKQALATAMAGSIRMDI